MKILFISVGKQHDDYIKLGVEDFSQRIKKYFPLEWLIISTPKNASSLSELELKKGEAQLILNNISKDDYLVLLDEKGKQFTSPQLAQFIQQRGNESCKKIVFLIGGAFGVNESIGQRANFTWSISPLVFPHMLVRLILSEQIYRACSILKNEKYHH